MLCISKRLASDEEDEKKEQPRHNGRHPTRRLGRRQEDEDHIQHQPQLQHRQQIPHPAPKARAHGGPQGIDHIQDNGEGP